MELTSTIKGYYNSFFDHEDVKKHLSKVVYTGIVLGLYFIRRKARGQITKLNPNLTGKVVIVTGSSDGLGLVTAKELLSKGATVVFACRNKSKTDEAISKLPENLISRAVFIQLDLSSFESVKKFVEEFLSKFERLDILVNNAGIGVSDFIKTKDGVESMLQTNTLSPILLTDMLVDILKRSNGRVVNVSSIGHDMYKPSKDQFKVDPKKYDFGESKFVGMDYYNMSKLGNVYFTKFFKKVSDQKKWGIKCCALHPGAIETGIQKDLRGFVWFMWKIMYPVKQLLLKTPFHGAQTTLHCAYLNEKDLADGEFYDDLKVTKLSSHAKDDDLIESYMNLARGIINNYGEKVGVCLKNL